MARRGFIRRCILAVFSEAGWQGFWTYFFPPLSGFATAGFGIGERQPVMWVMMAGATAFAMVSLGLLAFGQWRFKRTPEHKVQFARLKVDRGKIMGRDIIILGFVMKSTADFPIEATLTKMTTSIAARIPAIPIMLPRTILVGAGNDFWFSGTAIDIEGVTDEIMTGEVAFELEYGRQGGKKYAASNTQTIFVPLDLTKPFSTSAKLLPNAQQVAN